MNLIERARRAWHYLRHGTPYEWGRPTYLVHPGYYSFDGGKTWHSYGSDYDAVQAYVKFLTARRLEHVERDDT